MNFVTPDKCCSPPKTASLFSEKVVNDFVARKTEMFSRVSHDSGKRTDLQRTVQRHGEMVDTAALSRDPQVAACLPGWFITEMTQRFGEIGSGNIAWKAHVGGAGSTPGHAGITSSRTKCRRMTGGALPSSKWQRTASRMFARSDSR